MTRSGMTRRCVVPFMVLAVATAGCATGKQTGTVAGAGVGALVGQIAGGDTKATLIGAGIGAGVGYLIGNEKDKAAAQQKATTPPAEMAPFAGTAWQLLSVSGPTPKRPVKSLVARFDPDGTVKTTRTYQDGAVENATESYRVVGNTLIVNKPGYIINAPYKIDGDRLYLSAGDRGAVLQRV